MEKFYYDDSPYYDELTDELKESHSISNIVELNIYQIFKDIEKNSENFTDAETIEAINNNSEVFTPTINKTDDFLKRLIKQAIIDKINMPEQLEKQIEQQYYKLFDALDSANVNAKANKHLKEMETKRENKFR